MGEAKVQELILTANFLSAKRRNESVKRSKLQLKETQNPLQWLETGFFAMLIYPLIFIELCLVLVEKSLSFKFFSCLKVNTLQHGEI